jgi:hypothetical protein
MKKNVLYLIGSFFICSILGASASPATDAKAKAALKVIRLAYSCTNSNGAKFVEARELLTEPGSNKIIGQNLFEGTGWIKYTKVTLTWVNDDIPTAVIDISGDYPIDLKWNNDRVSEIAIQGLSEFDYTVNYNEKGEVTGFTGNKIIFKDRKPSYIIEYTGDQINKITGFESRISKDPWIRTITTFTYGNNISTGNTIQYTQWEKNTPKNIKSDYTMKVEKLDENRYLFYDPFGAKLEKVFDKDNGKVILEKNISKTGTESSKIYKYADNKMWREERLETNATGFVSRSIIVQFSLKDQPANVPEYDKTEGWYEFNKDGECIAERRDGKERKKENGVWGEWKAINYRY